MAEVGVNTQQDLNALFSYSPLSQNYIFQVASVNLSYGISSVDGGPAYGVTSTLTDSGTLNGFAQLVYPGSLYVTINSQNQVPGIVNVGKETFQIYGATQDGKYLAIGPQSGPNIANASPTYVISSSGAAPTTPLTISSSYAFSASSGSTGTPQPPTCFAAGTRIATTHGDVAVERIVPGIEVITSDGGVHPVRWVGCAGVQLRGAKHPDDLNPVVIHRGAIAPNVPTRDLRVTPGHRILIEGRLYQAGMLVNGCSIHREEVKSIEYFHIELDRPNALLAEGLAAESYIDVGNRRAFAGAVGHPMALPILDPDSKTETFAPVILAGDELASVRTALLDLALRTGWSVDISSDIRVEVAGLLVKPVAHIGTRAWFVLPSPATDVLLVSASEFHRYFEPDSCDDRRLGIQIDTIKADGREIHMQAEAFADGFYPCEFTDDDEPFRWTNGRARLSFRKPALVIEVGISRGARHFVGEEGLAAREELRIKRSATTKSA